MWKVLKPPNCSHRHKSCPGPRVMTLPTFGIPATTCKWTLATFRSSQKKLESWRLPTVIWCCRSSICIMDLPARWTVLFFCTGMEGESMLSWEWTSLHRQHAGMAGLLTQWASQSWHRTDIRTNSGLDEVKKQCFCCKAMLGIACGVLQDYAGCSLWCGGIKICHWHWKQMCLMQSVSGTLRGIHCKPWNWTPPPSVALVYVYSQ